VQLERTRDLRDKHTLDALVTGYEDLIPGLHLPDPGDRHVLAAANRDAEWLEIRAPMRITEHRSRARGLADLLLPFALIEDGILLQQDGSLLAGWSFRGPDMHSATHSEMHALTALEFHPSPG
jgi:hypothetical protein